jgi:hypothetical protein
MRYKIFKQQTKRYITNDPLASPSVYRDDSAPRPHTNNLNRKAEPADSAPTKTGFTWDTEQA